MSKFVKGDPRINRAGRKTSKMTQLRKDFDELSKEVTRYVTRNKQELIITRHMAILLNIIEGAIGGEPADKKLYLEFIYGKPAQQIDVDLNAGISVTEYDKETMEFAQKFLANGGDGNDQ